RHPRGVRRRHEREPQGLEDRGRAGPPSGVVGLFLVLHVALGWRQRVLRRRGPPDAQVEAARAEALAADVRRMGAAGGDRRGTPRRVGRAHQRSEEGVTVTGIEAVTYGVSDLGAARRFRAEWGLQKRSNGQTGAVFATRNGATTTIRWREANDLPAPIEEGSTVREVVWGVDSKKALQEIGAKLSRIQDVKVDRDGTIRA